MPRSFVSAGVFSDRVAFFRPPLSRELDASSGRTTEESPDHRSNAPEDDYGTCTTCTRLKHGTQTFFVPIANKLRGKKDLLRAGRGPSRGMKTIKDATDLIAMAFCDNPECLKCLNKDPYTGRIRRPQGERREPRSVGKVELGLVDRIGKLETALCRAHSQARSGDGRIHQASIHSTVTQIGG